MIEFTTLGAIELRRDGNDVRSVLSQPKRLALLLYLRLATPDGFVSRDRLLALFWPESDPERARNALRQSIHFLRRSLGADIVVNRGDQEVGTAPATIWCDAAAFEAALDAGRLAEALDLYRGELLPGFHVDDSPELDRWLEDTRDRLARRAVAAARTLSERDEARDELAAATVWARRGVALDPLGESAVRRLMTLLARSGERAGALAVFDQFARRLATELETEPAPATAALAEAIRAEGEHGPQPGTPRHGVPALSGPAEPIESAESHESFEPAEPADSHERGEPPERSASAGRAPHGAEAANPGPPRVAARVASGSDSLGGGRSDAALTPSPRARHSVRSVGLVLAAALLLIAGALIAPRLREPAVPPDDARPAIAVMPFLDMSPEGGREYFSDGVSESLLHVLARVPGLRVAARTSSFAFRSSDATADSIGRALNVTHLLEGSVRIERERVRVTVQLIETRGGFHLWSESYDRELGDVFALQDEIGREVVERLRLEFSGDPSTRIETTDADAHQLYLRGRHAWNRRTVRSIRGAIDYFEQALARDPGYARAWAGLAEAFVVYPQYAGEPPDEWYERAEAAAARAISLDPSLAEPHAALGLRFAHERADEAERHYRHALRLNPNYATAHHWYSIYFGERGRYRDQLREIRTAQSLDPLSPIIQLNLGKALLHLRRFDSAIAAYRRLIDLDPDFGFGHAVLAEALAAAGRRAEAAASAHRALEILGDEAHVEALASVGYALGRAGEREPALRIARALEEEARTTGLRPGGWGPAQVYAGTGEAELALDWIERAVAAGHWGGRPDLPFYDPIREDPRFREISRRFDRP